MRIIVIAFMVASVVASVFCVLCASAMLLSAISHLSPLSRPAVMLRRQSSSEVRSCCGCGGRKTPILVLLVSSAKSCQKLPKATVLTTLCTYQILHSILFLKYK